ncbi:MAG: SIR2 family protein [Alphaproteobacteria bacterium]|nr:SIR2 family protein [Alphaproteobacteria bacterium]
MSHKDSVALICSRLKPDNDARPTFLLGAGASFSSGIPLAAESVKRLAKQAYADLKLGGKTLPEQIKTSEWTTWLHSQEWFIHGDDHLAENFPLVIEHLLKPEAYRKKTLLDIIALRQQIGLGYHALAELILRGLAGTVLTTNFDVCLPKALNDKHPHIRNVAEVNRGPNDFIEFNLFARAQIVWLHGKTEQYSDRNLISETQTLDSTLVRTLAPLLESTPLIVIGYRGAEPSIMESLLGADAGVKFRHGIYWCIRAGEKPHPHVEALAARLGINFQYLEIEGFDEFLGDLNCELTGIQRFAPQPDNVNVTQFDDQPLTEASWGDIDADLALTTLRQYCMKLERGAIDSQQLKLLMRELGLLVSTPEGEKPSVACVLLFGRQPGRFFPHSVITTTVANKKRCIFNGNLIEQRNAVLEWFGQEEINPMIKVKGRRQHESRFAYPERALVELLVNMIVHRDYSIEKPAAINAIPNHSVRFENPGAQSQAAATRLELEADGTFQPVPQFSDLRNRALCDVFFGISAMERAGTGLMDARELAEQQGGTASFAYPPGEDAFVAAVFRPEASAGSTTVARDMRPVGTYVLNHLPFASIPQFLTHIHLNVSGWKELEEKVPIEDAGTFVFESRTGDLWSFLPARSLDAIFATATKVPARSIPLEEVEHDPVLRTKFSWLARKHFEKHLAGFVGQGLIIEKNKHGYPAKRAYFAAIKSNNRTIIYDTPLRRNVRRDVVKRRGEDRKAWFECEGFGYEVVQQAGVWGIRVKPFYMFVGHDGIKPLPGYLRTSKATRRIKFDRNANVESDLTFWARFLSKGAQTINIGNGDVNDLILEGGFVTVDIQEGGLINGFAENRRLA